VRAGFVRADGFSDRPMRPRLSALVSHSRCAGTSAFNVTNVFGVGSLSFLDEAMCRKFLLGCVNVERATGELTAAFFQ